MNLESQSAVPGAVHYIAEVLSWFDLVAIQELRAELGDLGRVMDVFGPYWKVIFSDVTEGSRGNEERFGFLYDKRAVVFSGLAAEAVAPPVVKEVGGKREAVPWRRCDGRVLTGPPGRSRPRDRKPWRRDPEHVR